MHKFWLKKPSVYAALMVWGASGFMGTPTIASGLYHILILPALLALVIWMAHHEGKDAAQG